MKTQTIEYDDGEVKARIVVSEANTLRGNKRSRLSFEAGEYEKANTKEGDPIDPDRNMVYGFYYPVCIAAAQSIDINGEVGDPDPDTFANLPDALSSKWLNATLELNPHWLPEKDDEKKESN